MNWTKTQERAIDEACKYLGSGCRYTIGGYAGTGKTTVTAEIINRLEGVVKVGSFTGKAASVLRRKGIVQAQTLHSMLYHYDEDEGFVRKNVVADYIVVDEASMVPLDIWHDLVQVGVPMLIVGDPGQLEPVGKDAQLLKQPNIILDVDHRFGGEIAWIANRIRRGETIGLGQYGPVSVRSKERFIFDITSINMSMDHGHGWIILCGFNATRHLINDTIRGSRPPLVEGERLICLSNNRRLGVFNGEFFTVSRIHRESWFWDVTCVDDDQKMRRLKIDKKIFRSALTNPRSMDRAMHADYGYAATPHKFQGSETESVYIFDEQCSYWQASRWRYTAITRAQEKVNIYV